MISIKKFFKNNFIAGLLVLGPLVATYYLLKFIISLLEKLLPLWMDPQTYLGFKIPGLRIVLAFIIIVWVGVLGRYYIFKKLLKWGEQVLHKLPVISGIYAALKKLINTFMGNKQQSFKNVVMVEFPRAGLYSIGFVTGVNEGETQEQTSEKVINVFIPTTPNPTSGFFVLIPESQLRRLEMSVEQAFALIISGGVIAPKSSHHPS